MESVNKIRGLVFNLFLSGKKKNLRNKNNYTQLVEDILFDLNRQTVDVYNNQSLIYIQVSLLQRSRYVPQKSRVIRNPIVGDMKTI